MPIRQCVAITTSKNDGDFIEAFIRGNAPVISRFILLDASTDCTREVVGDLVAEGFNIQLLERERLGLSSQVEALNFAVKNLAQEGLTDLCFPLDVDEVVLATPELIQETAERAQQEMLQPLRMSWAHFVPVALEMDLGLRTLGESFFSGTSSHQAEVTKVAIPGHMLGQVHLEPGNHGVRSVGRRSPIPSIDAGFQLAHFPIRSAEQIVLKTVTGLVTIRLKEGRRPGEGAHLLWIADLLAESSFEPNLNVLQFLALHYAGFSTPGAAPSRVRRKIMDVLARSGLGSKRQRPLATLPPAGSWTLERTYGERLLPDFLISRTPRHSVRLNLEMFRLIEELVGQVLEGKGAHGSDGYETFR